VLALTPVPLETAGERAFFDELHRWDTGGSIRAAVVASLPRFDDGPLRRRISDAVLFVPEGVAVVRVVEVERQSGTVTAAPDGAWTIGPAGRPGEVLQMAGGGSSPLDGLMRAGMDTAVRLRRAGLEPGRIARLSVLVGQVDGLLPADGDLGEGDQVATLDPRSLLLGIARVSRYAGVDNPRLWTTADVRAALEALALPGRGPSVDQLNGESFPYSPYVLRRPELLTPAALAAAPATAGPGAAADAPLVPQAPGGTPATQEPAPAVSSPAPTPAVAAAPAAPAAPTPAAPTPPAAAAPVSPAAAAPAVSPASSVDAVPSPDPVVPPRTRDTVAVDPLPVPASDDTGGIGGLFANAERSQPTAGAPEAPPSRPPVGPPRTAVLGAAAPAAPTSPVQSAPPPPPAAGGVSGRRTVLVAAAVLVLVVAIGFGAAQLFGGPDGTAAPEPTTTARETPAEGPQTGESAEVDGLTFTAQAVDTADTCEGRAYGEVAAFFAAADCTGLSRALYATQVEGRAAVVSVVRVQMPDTAAARDLQALADTNGTGNVNDLLREGVRYEGGPERLSGAEYASAVSGPTVTIVESSWVQSEAGDIAVLDRIAAAALGLETPALPE
jgi:hypothetical protein